MLSAEGKPLGGALSYVMNFNAASPSRALRLVIFSICAGLSVYLLLMVAMRCSGLVRFESISGCHFAMFSVNRSSD